MRCTFDSFNWAGKCSKMSGDLSTLQEWPGSPDGLKTASFFYECKKTNHEKILSKRRKDNIFKFRKIVWTEKGSITLASSSCLSAKKSYKHVRKLVGSHCRGVRISLFRSVKLDGLHLSEKKSRMICSMQYKNLVQ